MDYIIQDGELYHHGVLGQKWGVRRFQNKDGSLTQAGKKRVSRKQKKALEKARKAKQAKAEAAKKAKQEQAEFEANKKKALESGSAAEVSKYRGKLTNQELQQVVSRLNMEQRISELADKKEPTKVEKLTKKLNNANDLVDKGITGWDNIAKILNATMKTNLPIIKPDKKDKGKDNKGNDVKKVAGKVKDAIDKAVDKQQKKDNANDQEAKIAENRKKAQEAYANIEEYNRYEKLQAEANARFKAEREARAANKATSSERYVSGLLESGNKGSTTIAGLLSAPNQHYLDSGSNYIAGLLPAPRDDD